MYDPVLFRDRPLPTQILLGGVIPASLGALEGVLIGVSGIAYWLVAIVAAGVRSWPGSSTAMAGEAPIAGW